MPAALQRVMKQRSTIDPMLPPFGIHAAGGDVVDVAILHEHVVAVDVVDALGVGVVAQAGVENLAAPQRDFVRARDFHAVAPRAMNAAILRQPAYDAKLELEHVVIPAHQVDAAHGAVVGREPEAVAGALNIVGNLYSDLLTLKGRNRDIGLGNRDAA